MRAVADLGYDHGPEINACAEAGLEADGPQPSTSANTKLGLFGKERCTDDPEKDCYRCPAGEEWTCRCATTERGRPSRAYATGACRRCPRKEQCTRNNDGRRMTHGVDEPLLERMAERLKAHPEIMQERKPRGEHPFGTIKHANAQGSFLMKGLKNVRAAAASRAWPTTSRASSTALAYQNGWEPSAREGIDETFAPGRKPVEVLSVAHTENFPMKTRDLIPLHRRSP
jgi:hypothetical protein